MKSEILQETIQKLFTDNKGILAADESINSINKRFEALGIPQTTENHLVFRRVLLETPDISSYISGVIFHDETFRQEIETGKTFVQYCKEKGIVPGIKVDEGLSDIPNFPDEKMTLGIDHLKPRLQEYFDLGARFCKWRVVIDVKKSTEEIVELNLRNLAIYASTAQEIGLIPIVEPEVLYDGVHTIHECYDKMSHVITHLFGDLSLYKVDIRYVVLKTAMVLSGKQFVDKSTPEDIAEKTSMILMSTIPENIGGVVFLSGGQTPIESTLNLCNIVKKGPYRFPLTYSYSRALQDPVLKAFSEDMMAIEKIQNIFIDRLNMNTLALKGEYDLSKETGLSSNINQETVTHSQDL